MKKILLFFICLVLAFLLGSIFESASKSSDSIFISVDAQQFQKETEDKGIVILDIRTPEEFNKGRIASAKNIDYYASDFRTQLDKLDKSKAYKIYCNSGNRTSKTMEIMKELGFKNVTELSGGIKAWISNNFPTCVNC